MQLNQREKDVLQTLREKVKARLKDESTGHDWFHIQRVETTAVKIAEKEGADVFVVSAAALLHDLIDDKVVIDEAKERQRIENWLIDLNVSSKDRTHIFDIIESISFKGGHGKPLQTLEAKVVQDADRLDAIGAIGIARCFYYSGSKGQKLDDTSFPVRSEMTLEEYRNGPSTAINHFYEKLLKLKDRMQTSSGFLEAEKRHLFMEQFLEQFFEETR